MKGLLLALAVLASSLVSTAQAQSFTLSKDTVVVAKTVTNTPVKGTFQVVNTSGATGNYSWDLTPIGTAPSAWEFQVCDPNLCHNFGVTTATFQLGASGASSQGTFYMDLNPMNTVGSADYLVKVYPTGNPTAAQEVYYRFTFWPLGVTTVSSSSTPFNVYPNPTRDYLNMQLPAGNGRLEVYNVIGAKVGTYQVNPNGGPTVLPVQDLPKGAYIIRYQTPGRLLSRTFYKID